MIPNKNTHRTRYLKSGFNIGLATVWPKIRKSALGIGVFTGKNVFFEETCGQKDEKNCSNRADQEDQGPFAGEKFVHKNVL